MGKWEIRPSRKNRLILIGFFGELAQPGGVTVEKKIDETETETSSMYLIVCFVASCCL